MKKWNLLHPADNARSNRIALQGGSYSLVITAVDDPISIPDLIVNFFTVSDFSSLLSRMGVPASIKGYHFIRQAVMMAVEDAEVMIGITKGLYPDIARMYHTSASKVERAIRHAVESAWKKNGRQVYFEISGYHMIEKPTNGQFIAILAEYIRMRYGQSYQMVSYRNEASRAKESSELHAEDKLLLFS